MTAKDFYFVEYEDRIFIVERKHWEQYGHCEDVMLSINHLLPVGFQEIAESCFWAYNEKGKPYSKKKVKELLRQAGFKGAGDE